MDHGK
jgi:hypothetical protein